MLGVEDAGSSTTTTTTFSVSVATPILTTAAPAAVVATGAAGVGLLPLVAAATGDADPRSLLVQVPALSGGPNPPTNNTGTTTSPTNNNVSNSNISSSNPATMEQVEELVKPIMKDGEMILEVECGQNKAAMYLSKLCQGSKGPCIHFQGSWLTPNEFQFVSGRETAKDWKRSIRHHGKSLKLLLAKGILTVHPTMCDCEGCRIGAVLTRKGEKRRIPNGERKRKSTGNAPENSGNGAFRGVGNGNGVVKTPDGPTDPKRLALDKTAEGGQSPLKESSMLNIPESKPDGSVLRLPESHVTNDVSKLAVDIRHAPNPLMPLLSPDRVSDVNNGTTLIPPTIAKDYKDTKAGNNIEKRRHSSGQTSNVSAAAAAEAAAIPTPDVKVLSSSGNSGLSGVDKSMSRLALYQAVSASVKGEPGNVQSSGSNGTPVQSDSQDSEDEQSSNGSAISRDYKSVEVVSPKKEAKDIVSSGEKTEPVPTEAGKTEPKDLKIEDRSPKSVSNHSTVSHSSKPREPSSSSSANSSNSSSSSHVSHSTPLSPTVAATSAAAPSLAASHPMPSPAVTSAKDSHKEDRHKHSTSSSVSPQSSSSSSSHSRSSVAGEHITIRHPSPERRQEDTAPVTKHSPVKSVKEHTSEKPRDRKHETSSLSSSSSDNKDRHVSRETDSFSRHHSERETDRRRPEERPEKDRKSGITSGQSSKPEEGSSGTYRGPEYPGMGGDRAEGVHATAPVPVPTQMTDPAAFSEYMRVLAAGHHGLVPQPPGCLPPMFPIRPPTDVPGSAGLLHPAMHAAACGIFSTPSAMLPKDPVLYPTTAGTLPTASYGYAGAPGMTPLPLMHPQYQAAASTAMLDYSRPFPYMPWSNGIPFMMPDAMAAAAAAAASSSAKRTRDELESAADMSSKRIQLPMAYGAGSVAPMDYMAAYRGLAAPLTCGMESSMYDKNAEYLRKRLYPDLAASAAGSAKGMESPYLASLPDYYRALYSCRCMENRPGDIRTWSVEEVVKLVSSLDGCSVYTGLFREQRVDGKILVLLTTDQLMKNLNMKLGPAMTLTNRVAKLLLESTRTSGCDTCRRLASMVPAVQSAVGY